MSSLFLRTLRDDPADAEVPSHRLLVRAGYVRRNVAGIYTWLPLGKRVLDKVAAIVRDEMDGIGGQEVLFPALLPKEPYEATGRWTEYGDEIFRLVDRKGADYLLGPTHEEMFTLLVKGEYSSYRDLPVVLYQVQTKYRDEARPRSGILRAREFVMKDSYSFDLTDEALGDSYAAHRAAYVRMFDRMGLTYRIVQATAGAMGGSHSEEYLAPTPSGEDTYVLCGACGYAANAEAVPSVVGDVPAVEHGPVELIHTPDSATIEALATRLGVEASATLKTILVTVDGDSVAVAVPGDREVDITRLEAHVAPARVELLSEAAFADSDVLVKGYVGPQGLAGTAFRVIADPRVAVGTAWIAGGNQVDYHARNVVVGRDFSVDEYVDVASMLEGDPCPTCGGPLATDRGLELGHIFQLGRKYAAALGLDVDGPDGAPVTVTMGSYGVGISRAVAAIVEQSHDERGIIWPASVSPYDVHVTGVGTKGQAEAAAELAGRLAAGGLDVLLDDRDASAGVKFADADLVGVPMIVVVGRDYADGLVEVKDRRSGERRSVRVDDVLDALTA